MPKDQIRVKTLRNQSKAYDMSDQLKAEYSIMLNGQRYPLLTKTYKGFTSKASKSGKTRFNKIFNAPQSVKQEYINAVNNSLNMHNAEAKSDVGDNMNNQNVSSQAKSEQKQDKDILVHSKLPYDKAPDSVAVFNADKKQDEEKAEEPLEEEEPKPMPKPPVMKKGGKLKKKGGVLQGPSHDNGGIPIEAEGGEFVVNTESTKHFEPQLKKINDAGNELRDAKQPQLRRRKMKKINQMKRKMRKGGLLKYRQGGKVSEIQQPSTGRGLVGTLSKDDGVKDKGMYQELINKYFTKMDFTQTLKYVKNKNKDVEKMGADALRETAQDIAQQVKTQVKYNGSVVAQLKKQVYELIAIRLAMQQQPKKQEEQKGNIGLVVDMESVFGEGSEVDKQAFAEKYMRGGRINEEKLKEDMKKPEDLENIVVQGKDGKDGMTMPKPEQKKAFQDFQTLSAGQQSEGAISRGESSYTRKTFNLPMALNGSVEMGWRQRYAQEIDENNEEFKKPQSIFKYRKKSTKKGRRNLLN